MDNPLQPLISIVVPVYKVEKYLDKCVASLVTQTYRNLEILLVDDGSPDSCPGLCDQWAARDSRITVIHKKNGGLSDARNAGIDRSCGEYITFVDSDDYVQETYVEILYNTLAENNADVAACNFQRVDENNCFLPENPANQFKKEACSGEEVLHRYFVFNGTASTLAAACAKLFKRALFSDLRFAVGRLHEDEFLFFPMYMRTSRVAFTAESLYFYLQRQGSILHSHVSTKRIQDICDYCEERLTLVPRNSDLSKKISVNYALQIFAVLDRVEDQALTAHLSSIYRKRIIKICCRCVEFPLFHKLAYLLVTTAPKPFATLIHRRHYKN